MWAPRTGSFLSAERCVLGWGVLTWARPVDSDSAKRSDARRVRWHRVGYRAPLGAHRGTLSTPRGDDSKKPALSARAGSSSLPRRWGVAWPPGRAMTKRIVALHYSLCWGAHPIRRFRSGARRSGGGRFGAGRRKQQQTKAPPKCIVVRSGHGVACRSVTTSPSMVTTSCLSSTGGWPIQPVRVYVGLK